MSANVFKKITDSNTKFSKGQKAIAKYITEHYDKAAFMTASKLGNTVGVSESTVVRFAMELGYKGYPELQKALQEMIRNKLTAVQRIEVANDRIGNSDIFSSVLNSDIEKIRQTLEEQDMSTFDSAVDTLLSARRIYILGVRSSASLATFMGFYFNLIFDNIRLVNTTSASEMFEQIIRIQKEDAVIGISFPRYSKRTIQALRYAKDNNANVIAITDSKAAPLSKYADYLLIARSDMASFVDSLVAPLSLINALIVSIAMKKKEYISNTFTRLESIWDEYQVYEKPGED